MSAASAAKNRTELLTGWALEAGFDRAGVASLESQAGAGASFLRRLERGLFASMAWLGRRPRRRLVPASLLDGARSVVCVALHYHPLEGEPEPEGDLWPRVARYARGDDYHPLMERRLRALAARIREAFPGAGARLYVDTGPVLERELAARAGLGAIAKNTMLLDRTGSWFLLGELFLTLELEPSEPLAEDLCGNCRRCLDACPTGALPAPYVLDAGRCISYWTRLPGGVPLERPSRRAGDARAEPGVRIARGSRRTRSDGAPRGVGGRVPNAFPRQPDEAARAFRIAAQRRVGNGEPGRSCLHSRARTGAGKR